MVRHPFAAIALVACALWAAGCGAPAAPSAAAPADPAPRAAAGATARATFAADPLPPGALRRYGSHRLRHRFADDLDWLDGQLLSASTQATRVWDPASGALVSSYPDGGRIAAAPGQRYAVARHRELRIVDARSGSEKALAELDAPIRALRYSGDGQRIAALLEDGAVALLDAAGAALVERLAGPEGYGAVMAIDHAGTTVAAAREQTLRVWRDGQLAQQLDVDGGVRALAFFGEALVVSGSKGTSVYDVDAGQPLHALGSGSGARVVAASATLIALGDGDGEVALYDGSGRGVGVWQSGRNEVRALAFSRDGRQLAALVYPGVIRLYDTVHKRDVTPPEAHAAEVRRVVVSPDGRFVVSADGAGYVCIWDRATAQLRHRLKTRVRAADGLAISPDGKRLVCGDRGRWIDLYALETGRLLASTRLFGATYDAAWSPDGKRIAIADSEGEAWLLDARDLSVDKRLSHGGEVRGVAFSPDGRSVATAGSDAYLELWDVDSGLPRATLRVSESPLDYAHFSPDGARILVGWYDRLQIHDVRSGLRTLHLEGIGWDSLQPAWSPDGKQVVAAGKNEEAYLIDARTGAIAERIAGHLAAPRAFAFTPDGAELITGSDDTTLLAWRSDALPDAPHPPPELDERQVTPAREIERAPALPTRDDHRPPCAAGGDDGDGAPLPHCALLRVGTRRFRVPDGVSQLAYAPDGTLAAGGDWDTSLLFDADTGRVKRRFWHENMGLTSLAFSPDGDLLAGATSMDGVRVWRTRDGSLEGFVPTGWVFADAMVFSPRGDKLFVGKSKRLFVHDLKHRQQSFTHETFAPITRMSISDDGAQLLVSGEDGQGVLLSARDGEPIGTADAGVEWATLLPGGGLIGIDGDRQIVSGALGATAPTSLLVDAMLDDLRVSADGSTMALYFDEHIDIYDTRPPRHRTRIPAQVEAAALSFDGRRLATALGSTIDQWDTSTGQRIAAADGHRDSVQQIVFDAQGRLLTAADDLRVWDQRGQLVQRFAFDDHAALVLSADGQRGVFIHDNKWYRWTRQGDRRSEIVLQGDPTCMGVSMSSDGQRLACKFYGEGVTLFDAGGRRLQRLLPGQDVAALAFHPDGRQVALVADHALVLAGAGAARTLSGEQIERALFSPDGATLYAMTGDDRVLVLDSRDLRVEAILETREETEQMALSPSGEIAVMLAASGHMEIWDMKRRRLRYRLAGGEGAAALAFSPDGTRLAVGGTDTTAVVFDATKF